MCQRSHRRTVSLGFTPERVLEGQHICYIYNDDTERRRVMAKYFESGALEGERLLYLTDTISPQELLDSFAELGVDVQSFESSMVVSEAAPAYCPSGIFNVDEMLDTVRVFYSDAVDVDGYSGARGTGEMSWCLADRATDEEAIMEYEARLNLLLTEHPYTACCQYDARRFSGNVIMDVLSVHPVMIVRSQLVRNPYYIDPAVFLATRRNRDETTEGQTA